MSSPLWTVLGRHRGVRLRSYGHGPAVIVIPGMEGSGESCLDLVLPVVNKNVPTRSSVRRGVTVAAPRLPADDLVGTSGELGSGWVGTLSGLEKVPVEAPAGVGGAFAGTPGRVILVDYAAERHRLLGQLVDTIAGLLRNVVRPDEPLVWWGQSFGSLLVALVRQQFDQPADRTVLVSPFTGLPPAKIHAARLALAMTPGGLYASTAGTFGRVLFGPDPDNTGGPFFGALAAMHPLTVRRRLGWLGGQDFASAFLALPDPLAVWLGERDRLIDLPRQLAFFGALTRRPGDQLTILGGCGHVVLPSQAMDAARASIRSYLTSPATPRSTFQG